MGKRTTRVTASKPTVATEPSERHFDETEPSDPAQFEPATDEVLGAHEVLAPASATATSTPEPAKPRQRRISAETVKAKSYLIRLEKAAEVSKMTNDAKWAEKRSSYIGGLPHDVQGMLLAGGVITDDDLEGLPPREKIEP
jgi:hypothetical protein